MNFLMLMMCDYESFMRKQNHEKEEIKDPIVPVDKNSLGFTISAFFPGNHNKENCVHVLLCFSSCLKLLVFICYNQV